jgi:hypothetical protein
MGSRRFAAAAAALAAAGLTEPLASQAAEAQRCAAASPPQAALLVELYTSEGCESCPPADRWLSALKPRPDVVAMAFHVDYWNRLGWADRFASPAYTQRQVQQQRINGARFSYTPQLVVDGRDSPGWRTLALPPAGSRPAAAVALQLQRDGPQYTATVKPLPGAPARLAAFWAVTENGHLTRVKAGENRGATLAHDFVVREYRVVSAWTTPAAGTTALQFTPAMPPDPAHPRQTALVVVDADTGRPVQALELGC